MKRKVLIIAMVALVAALGFSSCEKIKEKLFEAFVTNATDVDFTINIITKTDTITDIGLMFQTMNIDSIIKKETDDNFSLDDISSVNIEEVKVTVLNPDAANNIANFQEGWLEFNTDFNTTPILVASGLNPDVYSDTWFMPVDKNQNLKPYLKGTHLAYVLQAKARRVTTKPLDCKLAIKFKIK